MQADVDGMRDWTAVERPWPILTDIIINVLTHTHSGDTKRTGSRYKYKLTLRTQLIYLISVSLSNLIIFTDAIRQMLIMLQILITPKLIIILQEHIASVLFVLI